MREVIITALNAGQFAEAVKAIESLELLGSEGARALNSSEWFDDAGGKQFKVDYCNEVAETVQIVGTADVYHRAR